jgi:hypothetical protein
MTVRVILLDLAIAFGFGAGEMDHKVWGSMFFLWTPLVAVFKNERLSA